MMPRMASTAPRFATVLLCGYLFTGAAQVAPRALQRLQVSPDKHYLVTADGRPFFWLGDTAWELFHRLDRGEAERYLQNRSRLRFTVIQAVALAELDGLTVPNAYGETPLRNNDPAQPNE